VGVLENSLNTITQQQLLLNGCRPAVTVNDVTRFNSDYNNGIHQKSFPCSQAKAYPKLEWKTA